MINYIKKKIKQHFCEHLLEETDVYVYYPPYPPYEPSGDYYKHKKLKCVKCGKIFR